MTTINDILEQFQMLNVEASEEVVSKCLQMCLNYNMDAEELVDQWLAYTATVLGPIAPTVQTLEKMERKELLKFIEPAIKTTPAIKEQSSPVSSRSYHFSSPNTDVLYTPKENSTHMSTPKTPVQTTKLLEKIEGSIVSSPGTLSGTYSSRTDSQSVRCYYGLNDAQFKRNFNANLMVTPNFKDNLRADQIFMYEVLGKKARCLNTMTEYVLKAIAKKYKLYMDRENKMSDKVNSTFFGRVVPDADGKINIQSILLEQTQGNYGSTVYLNFSKLSKYSLFPGQCLAVRGSYEKSSGKSKDKILVEEVYADTNLDLPLEPPITDGHLQLIIASGPFTTQDNLLFEPLKDLLLFTKECKPNVLLLMGPFYETSHPGIKNGELRQNFESLFFDVMDNIIKTLENNDIHVIIVSSHKEPHHFPVYPSLPYQIKEKYENLTFMPDPAMINVNGLIIGATTADVLFDLGNFEIHMDKNKLGHPDRLGRIASYLLQQQSFYPLHPPHNGLCVDMSLMETNGIMQNKPHILLLPSNLRHFVKEVNDCLIINPERLTKGNGGGTFARIEIRSGLTSSVCSRTACQILKI